MAAAAGQRIMAATAAHQHAGGGVAASTESLYAGGLISESYALLFS